jgi:dynein heavy chain 1
VGDQEIDFSDKFVLFMITRNPSATFTPDLCSRVTFVNFTVTPSSLQNQCLNIYLKNEREEIDRKRSDLLKLQGECKVKLRELEDSLLDALNKSEGNILDNNALISTLETLKKEAATIAAEVEKTEDTMKEIELVSNQYLPLSNMTSRIFFTLDTLSQISFLYQYSLQHFMDYIFAVLLSNEELQKVGKNNPEARLQIITRELFLYVYVKIAQGLLLEHQALFALRLTQIRVGSDYDSYFEVLLRSGSAGQAGDENLLGEGRLSKTQARQLEELASNKLFTNVLESLRRNQ